jgi:hypothetical protein
MADKYKFNPYTGQLDNSGLSYSDLSDYQKKYAKVVVVAASNGDYTSVQDALDDNVISQLLVLVAPGTYTNQTVNFTANAQVVKAMGKGNNTRIQRESGTLVDAADFTGCAVEDLRLELTAANAAGHVCYVNDGALTVNSCRLDLTAISGSLLGAQRCLCYLNGSGSLVTKMGEFYYTNSATSANERKTAFSSSATAAGELLIKRGCKLIIDNSNASQFAAIYIAVPSGAKFEL